MSKFLLVFLYPILFFILFSCAQKVPPSGGEKDIIAPEVISSNPSNFSTQFNSKKIEIVFDEYIKLDNINDNLIVSPVLKNDPDILAKGKSLIFTLNDTLAENTTYVINFGESIIDITEKNAKSGFQYVFSTGNNLDSLELKGKVIEAFTLTPKKNVLVMLYENVFDSVPYLEKPRYISKTNDNGEFHIKHVKEGSYKIFALGDINKNYLFDLSNEIIGFSDTLVQVKPDSAIKQVILSLFVEDHEKQYLKKNSSDIYGRFVLKFNQPVDSLVLRDLGGSLSGKKLILEANEKKDSLIYWISPPDKVDSVLLELSANDTIWDTVNIRIKEKKPKKNLLQITSNAGQGGRYGLDKPLQIRLNQPAKNIDSSLMFLYEDSIKVHINWNEKGGANKVFEAHYKWKENTKYRLIILPKAFTDFYGNTNDSLDFSFTTREVKSYGTLLLSVDTLVSQSILQLMNGDELVDEQIITQEKNTLSYNYLLPGKYHLKLIDDQNNNGKWDPGNYLMKRQAEKVTLYPGTITIRSNWDQEIKWVLN